MATECRAKDPTTCRMHGNPTISNLQTQADQAALNGNAEEYIALRQKIDEAHENPASSADSSAQVKELKEQIIEAGARASFGKAMKPSFKWETSTDRTHDFHKKHVEAALAAAEPHLKEGAESPKAVRAVQKSLKTTMAGTGLGSSYRFEQRSKEMAQAILSETSSLRDKLRTAEGDALE